MGFVDHLELYRAEVLSNSGTVNEKIMKYIRSNSRTFKVGKIEREGDSRKKKEADHTNYLHMEAQS